MIDPTPRLETGWANFDSSFGEPMVTNGDEIADHPFFNAVEQNTQNIPPLDSVNTISSVDIFTRKSTVYLKFKLSNCMLYKLLHIFFKDQEVADKINNDLLTTNTSFSEQLSENGPLTDNSTTLNVKSLPNVSIISNTTDVSLIGNTHDVNSVDR